MFFAKLLFLDFTKLLFLDKAGTKKSLWVLWGLSVFYFLWGLFLGFVFIQIFVYLGKLYKTLFYTINSDKLITDGIPSRP